MALGLGLAGWPASGHPRPPELPAGGNRIPESAPAGSAMHCGSRGDGPGPWGVSW